jgi:hypothetical protein
MGIETSYRVKGEFKPKTTSKNYVVRLFYFLFSVCLYNLWVLSSIFIDSFIRIYRITKPLISAKFFGALGELPPSIYSRLSKRNAKYPPTAIIPGRAEAAPEGNSGIVVTGNVVVVTFWVVVVTC